MPEGQAKKSAKPIEYQSLTHYIIRLRIGICVKVGTVEVTVYDGVGVETELLGGTTIEDELSNGRSAGADEDGTTIVRDDEDDGRIGANEDDGTTTAKDDEAAVEEEYGIITGTDDDATDDRDGMGAGAATFKV